MFDVNQSFFGGGCLKINSMHSFFNQRTVFNDTLIHTIQLPKNIVTCTFRNNDLCKWEYIMNYFTVAKFGEIEGKTFSLKEKWSWKNHLDYSSITSEECVTSTHLSIRRYFSELDVDRWSKVSRRPPSAFTQIMTARLGGCSCSYCQAANCMSQTN